MMNFLLEQEISIINTQETNHNIDNHFKEQIYE